MKKQIKGILIVIFSFTLFACATNNKNEEESFIGTIEELYDAQAIVAIESGDILRSGDKAGVDLTKADGDISFEIGDQVKVYYTGGIGESYPLTITTVAV